MEKFKEKLKKISYDLWIKLVLFRIWFFKNIVTFVYVAVVVLVALTLCGVFPETVPLLGQIGELFEFQDRSLHGILATLITITSIIISIYIVATRIQKIGLSDIKSRKVKIMMATAGLRFNSAGKIIKIENETTDIDSKPIISIVEEAATILTASTDFANAQAVDNGSDNLEIVSTKEEKKEEKSEQVEEPSKKIEEIITEEITEGKEDNIIVKTFKKMINRVLLIFHKIFKRKADEMAERQADLLEKLNSNIDQEMDKVQDKILNIVEPEKADEIKAEIKEELSEPDQVPTEITESIKEVVEKQEVVTEVKQEPKSKQQSAFNAFMRGK